MNRLQAVQQVTTPIGITPTSETNELLRTLIARFPQTVTPLNNSPIVTPLDERIRAPRTDATDTEAHMIRASRGEEMGFYQVPQLF